MPERFASGRWAAMHTGAPSCVDAVIALDCRVASAIEVGTHTIFLAEVMATRIAESCAPLAYCDRSYATTQVLRMN
jgi:flavin reductase (NADH)/flavin reductase/chlorophenol-4-monooxygenase component 1